MLFDKNFSIVNTLKAHKIWNVHNLKPIKLIRTSSDGSSKFLEVWKVRPMMRLRGFIIFQIFLFKWNSLICCSLITKSCLTLCDPVDCSRSGSSVLHCFLGFAQIHVYWIGDANYLIQHEGLFQWVSSSHQMARVIIHI